MPRCMPRCIPWCIPWFIPWCILRRVAWRVPGPYGCTILTVVAGDGGGGARRGRQGGAAAIPLAALGGEHHAAPRQAPQGALDRQQAHVLRPPWLLPRHRRRPPH
eukprot:scaffold116675_cov48-Phaeocystis_antarctica.AAC.1